jgi:hypothetical protein
LLVHRFGEDYAGHPKLHSVAVMNSIPLRHFVSGKEEAQLVADGNHGAVRRSTAEKSRVIRDLTVALLGGVLKTRYSAGTVGFAGENLDAVQVVMDVARRCLYVQRSLKDRRGDRPTLEIADEYDVQDLLRSLFRLFFDDIRAEEWAPGYAGGASRIDILLPEFKLAVELKHARDTLNARRLGEELIVDSAKYSAHPDVRHLICLVFDHAGRIENPRGLERDLRNSGDPGMAVTVLILDR